MQVLPFVDKELSKEGTMTVFIGKNYLLGFMLLGSQCNL